MQLAESAAPVAEAIPRRSGAPDADERLARVRLARSENVGPRTYAHLMRRFGSAARALEALPALARRGGRKDYRPCPAADAEAELAAGEAAGARLVTAGEAGYPPLLAAIDSAPPVLWTIGRAEVLARRAVGVVGARNASALGLRSARRIAEALGERGFVVVSGLARGIDRAAHEATLATGTIAVMAGGVDRVFPPENAELAGRIGEAGALVSECAMGTEPTGRHFPRRNRLISGLSEGVLLIEAALRSGSLITARYALDQGREVMACPGAAEDPRAGGCNHLIRQGAALIRSAEDVLEALAAPRQGASGLAEPAADFLLEGSDLDGIGDDTDLAALADFDEEGDAGNAALAEQVMRLLGAVPVEADELARLCGATAAELSLALLELDLAGRIELGLGGTVALAPPPDCAEARRRPPAQVADLPGRAPVEVDRAAALRRDRGRAVVRAAPGSAPAAGSGSGPAAPKPLRPSRTEPEKPGRPLVDSVRTMTHVPAPRRPAVRLRSEPWPSS